MAQRRAQVTAQQLRADFDESFARAHASEPPPQLDLLVIRVADHRYALLLSQVVALHADRKLTEAPSQRRELLGLVGLRGLVTPVFDLSALLGYGALAAARWLVQVNAPAAFAVAFEHFEQHVRVPVAALAPITHDTGNAHRYASSSVSTPSGPVTVLDLLAIFRGSIYDRRADSAPKPLEERP